jgi:hypothetical protein
LWTEEQIGLTFTKYKKEEEKALTNLNKYFQGFIDVDTAASPEEKHVANMQINGYESSTYKYFEASTA